MTIPALITRARRYPVFTIADCHQWFPEMQRVSLTVALSRAVTRGYLLHLKRGVFALNEPPFPNADVIASRLDTRATMSLETVLFRAGMLAETSFAVTAVTPAGSARYDIPTFGTFLFRHHTPALDFGWTVVSYPPYAVRVAHTEKALLDLLWYHRHEREREGYARELRLRIPPTFSWRRFRRYVQLANHDGCTRLARACERVYAR